MTQLEPGIVTDLADRLTYAGYLRFGRLLDAQHPLSGGAGEPKIWFASMRSVAEVLSNQNRALLKVIRERNPDSVAVLAITGRQPSNLSRTLKTMSRYGLVDLRREKTHLRPVVKATDFRILATA